MQDRDLLRTHHSLEHLRERSQSIGREFFAGFEAVEQIDRPAVSCFGSARAPAGSRPYELARETARLFAEAGWAVVTGGGPGLMEAANRGCREGKHTKTAGMIQVANFLRDGSVTIQKNGGARGAGIRHAVPRS